ncbi:prominin-2 [Gadus chalcogrammus]|uniref:prominin-2 n=1 Tax=Gadus chalcogrammus TaxID=1042646 RepID=UPI0024C4B389|nr:prominin-2 [Gadus chalcogrammus]
MGPSEGPWAPRGRACAGARRAAVVLLLLGSAAAQTPAPSAPCGNGTAPPTLRQPGYPDSVGADPGAGFMAPLVQSFLDTVQPSPFPGDLILSLTKDFNKLVSDPEIRKAALRYETGFLVCVAIGVLYIVLMPLVGIFLVCCRCCGNCGGEMYQKQTSSINCWRRSLYWSLFLTTVVILAGNICMFKSNEAFKLSVDQGQGGIITAIDNIQTFITDVPQQITYVVNASYKTVDEVTENLGDIGPQLGSRIQGSFRIPLKPALDSVDLLERDALKTDDLLNKLNGAVDQLQRSIAIAQANVTAVKTKLNDTIYDPDCYNCTRLEPELQKLTVDTTLEIPNLSGIQTAVDEVIKAQLQSVADDYLHSIPQRVTNDTRAVILTIKEQLRRIEAEVSQGLDGIPPSALGELEASLERAKLEVKQLSGDIQKGNHIKWAVGVVISVLVLLVVLCNALGLLLGPAGLRPGADPRERSCTAASGGSFLLMGAGFSFLYSWLFMLLVLLLFLLGGNLYTLVCKPWTNGELLQFIDASGLVPSLPNNVTFGGIYSDCTKNMPIWSTLSLSQNINLEAELNISKYTAEIVEQFENSQITLSSITLLSPEVRKQLGDFPDKLKQIDFDSTREKLTNITELNLNTSAGKIDRFAVTQPIAKIKAELNEAATDLRAIQRDMETVVFPQIENLKLLINELQVQAVKTNGTVATVSSEVGKAQDFLNTNTTSIVKAESRAFLKCQMQLFDAYAAWAILTITEQVGRCRPVSGAVDAAVVIVCSNVVESLNAFWFSLGWCMIFFIPSIILSIKLSKYYRKMKRADEFNKHIAMNQIPRATMLQY